MLVPEWEPFYLIVGAAAGALAGLMFVAITLISEFRGSGDAIDAFGTPTVVHFGSALLVSIIVAAPWPFMWTMRLALAAFGALGTFYMVLVLRRARSQSEYKPVFEDWLFHTALPFVAYGILAAAAFDLGRDTEAVLFAVAASTLLLLFIGIHNAWDTVTWIAVVHSRRAREATKD